MAKITKGNAAPVMLPALDAIGSAKVADLPQSRGGRAGGISDDERKLAAAIAAAWGADGTMAAMGPKLADKETATRQVSRVKRLVKACKLVPEGKRLVTRTVVRDDGFAWAINLADAKPAPAEAAPAEATEPAPAEGDAPATA